MELRSLAILWLFVVGVLSGQVLSHFIFYPEQPIVAGKNVTPIITPQQYVPYNKSIQNSTATDFRVEMWYNGTKNFTNTNVTYVTYNTSVGYHTTYNTSEWAAPGNYTTIYALGGGGGAVIPNYLKVNNVTR